MSCGLILVVIIAFIGITQAMLRVPYWEHLEGSDPDELQSPEPIDEIGGVQNMQRLLVKHLMTYWKYLSNNQKKTMINAIIALAPYNG